MPQFSQISRLRLQSVDPRLHVLCTEVIKHWDCTVICGHRGQEEQDELYRTGKSKLRYPHSLHNRSPSYAVDLGPYYPGEGIPWEDFDRWRAFGGFVLGVGAVMGTPLRWGGDWDGDRLFTDQNFHDLPHFELLGW